MTDVPGHTIGMVPVMSKYGIKVIHIGPGYIATPQTALLRGAQADGSKHPIDSYICEKTPAG